jgi:hypothetical protein
MSDVMEKDSVKEFVKQNGHVLKGLRLVERNDSIFAEFEGSDGTRNILMPSTGITRVIDENGMTEVSCDHNDNYDAVVGVAVAEKKAILKREENRGFPRYKKAMQGLVELIRNLEDQ